MATRSERAARSSQRYWPLAERERRFERTVALVAVIAPTVGAIGALAAAWAWGLGWTELVLWGVGHVLTACGVAIGYHRLVSHRAFETRRWLEALFVFLGSTGLQGPVLWWAAIHRRHHATSERPGDPHSPHLRDEHEVSGWRGFWHAHMGWLFVHEQTDWMHYVPDLLRDRLLFRLNQYYFVWVGIGLAVPAAIGGAVHGTWQGAVLGLLWGGFLRIFTTQHATWCINSVCHLFGTRPFESRDAARNNALVAVATVGEGWHNNHHAFPGTAINQFEWWQFDFSGAVVRLLRATGLAWNVQFPSREALERNRRQRGARSGSGGRADS